VMTTATKYKSSADREEQRADKEKRHAAARVRLKADYDKEVDSEKLYEAYKDESLFVEDRNQVLTLVFCWYL